MGVSSQGGGRPLDLDVRGGGASSQAEPSKGKGRAPSPEDLAQARRIAAFGEPKGLLGLLFYSLAAGPRRRVLRRELRETMKKLEAAEREVDRRYLEYARGLHARASEEHVPALQPYVGGVDHAMLRKMQVEAGRSRRRDREIQEERVRNALLRLADTAMAKGHARLDPQNLERYRAANREADRLDREAWLRELGIEMYDAKAVLRGRLVIGLLLAVVVATAVAIWRSM